MSRVTRPVRPNAVVWNKEGKVVMHHCRIARGKSAQRFDSDVYKPANLGVQDSVVGG